MKKNSRKHATRVGVYSALAGGAVGFALGMLFAPKRGPVARRRITYQLERLTDQAGGVLRRLVQSSVEREGRRNSDAVVEDAETRADHIRDDIDALMEELRQASQNAGDAD
ncbi:MAG: YtxH domain-containing protein [Salinibacter sp.]